MHTVYFVIKSSAVEHQKKEEDSKRNPLTIWKTRILQTQIGNMYEISGLEFGRTTAGREPEPDSLKGSRAVVTVLIIWGYGVSD